MTQKVRLFSSHPKRPVRNNEDWRIMHHHCWKQFEILVWQDWRVEPYGVRVRKFVQGRLQDINLVTCQSGKNTEHYADDIFEKILKEYILFLVENSPVNNNCLFACLYVRGQKNIQNRFFLFFRKHISRDTSMPALRIWCFFLNR